MGDLSANFSRHEFACKCGCGFDAINPAVVEILQILRNVMRREIRVTSGCRCFSRNAAVGGVRDSQHICGKAADITCDLGAEIMFVILRLLYEAKRIPNLAYCQLYKTENFVHIDVGPDRVKRFVE
ncbi:hypothetical protein FACS1894204_11790 [Synergistales bacterium]|nr:hypothetical protein FACS1894204_11790 [Synergistales bacterium]